ncbi:MAG: redox-sensing transcriptional repressor Rex [Candidatus Nanopelagicales bacterium]
MAQPRTSGLPAATVERLPVYLRALNELKARGVEGVSSEELADAVNVTSAQLRKDLSYLGGHGTRGVGYDVTVLIQTLASTLGVDKQWPLVIVGAGNLGMSLAKYAGFANRGFKIAAIFDAAPEVIGKVVEISDGQKVFIKDVASLATFTRQNNIQIAVITTPVSAAQSVCDTLVNAGIYSIMTFAPVTLNVPSGVDVRHIDLASELQILTFHEQTKANEVIAI